jgi:hypothetical protein
LAIGNEAPNQGQTEAGELLPDLICATLAGGETTAKREAEAEVMPRELAPTPGSTDDAAPAPEPEAEPEGKAESSVDAEAAAMTEANREPSAESAVEALAATDAAEVPPEKAVRPDEDPPEWSDAASAVLPEENATDEHAEPPAGDSIIDSTYRPLGPAPPTDADTPVDWETPPAPEAAPEETAVAPEAELESAVDLPGPELLAEEVTVADVGEMAVAAEFEPEEAALGQDSAESSTIPAEKDLTVLAPPEKDPGSAEEPGEQAPVPAALLLPAEEAPTEAVDSTTERKLESAPMPERTEPIEPKPEELDTADGEDRLPLVAEDSATDGNAASLKLEALPAGSDPQPGTDLGTADDDGDIGEQPAESSSVSRLLAANDEQALQEYTNLPIDEEPEEVSDIPIEDCDAGA